MSDDTKQVMGHVWTFWALYTAEEIMRQSSDGQIRLPDPFPQVLQWLWDNDRRAIPYRLAAILAELLNWDREPSVTVEEFIFDLELRTKTDPDYFQGSQQAQLMTLVRDKLPGYFGRDVGGTA